MDPGLRFFASRQDSVVASWQLREVGWTPKRIRHHVARGGWQRLHRGVFLTAVTPPTRNQLWWAAALTSPDSFLSHGSAGACFGFYRFHKPFEVITRTGRGGRRRHGRVLVFRSKTLGGETTRFNGIPITTAARVLIDLAPGLNDDDLGRAFREAIRLKRTTAQRMRSTLIAHEGAPGTAQLSERATRYADIPYHRTRSDAEGRALELVHDAGAPPPRVNESINGEEADLIVGRVIVEIDGPQYHLFPDEDARKTAAWEAAGYVVRRVPSDAVYDRPEELLAKLGL